MLRWPGAVRGVIARRRMGSQWRYATPKEVHDLIKSSKISGKDYVVVDVRDDDFVGGNIKGCLRSPFHKYETGVSELVPKVKDVPTVVFHCTFSQVRGPKSARIYAETRDALLAASGEPNKQEVLVLQGGFAAIQAAYKDDEALIENWDKAVWEDAFF